MGKFGFIKKVINNKIIHYVLSRYLTYFVQFINSLFIAIYLGPYYLGIWGFILLVIQYLNQFNMGIPHSANAIISINKNKGWYVEKVIRASLSLIILFSISLSLCYFILPVLGFSIGSKYSFSNYSVPVLLIGVFSYFNSFFNNVFRVYGKLFEIAFNQTVFPVCMLICIFIFEKENLLWALVWANLFSFFISFLLYIFRSPVKLGLIFDLRLFRKILIRGWFLFIYNSCFYLIIITSRSFVSSYYSVAEFGFFTFAFSLANVILLLLQSISYLIYPKLLNKLAKVNLEESGSLIKNIRDVYITSSHFLLQISILGIPVFLFFLPQYSGSEKVFRLVVMSIILYSNSFGYSGLLISKNLEKKLSKLSFTALIINITLAYFLADILGVNYVYVIIATLVSYSIYIFMLGYLGRKVLGLPVSLMNIINDLFPLNLLLPYLLSLIFIVSNVNNWMYVIPLLVFVFFNKEKFFTIKKSINKIISNPNFINI